MKSGIYIIHNKINGKKYIGSATNTVSRIWLHKKQLNQNNHINKYLQRAWNKYKAENFEFLIIEYVLKENLMTREQHYLDLLKSYQRKHGYNICVKAGSGLGYKHSEEAKNRMRIIATGRKHSIETKKKLSIINTGKKPTEETRRKLSELMKGNKYGLGRKDSEETKRRKAMLWLGRKHTEYSKAKLKGNKHALGYKHTEEAKRKISLAGINNKHSLGFKHTLETRKKGSASRMGHSVSVETRRKLSIAAKKQWERKYECGYHVSTGK